MSHTKPSKSLAQPSRRRAIGMLGTAPLMLSGTSLFALTGCGGSDSPAAPAPVAPAPVPKSVKFNSMAAPTLDADRATTFTSATIDITYADGTTKAAQALSYVALYKTGDALTRPDGSPVVAGGYYLPDGITPIIDTSVAPYAQAFSDAPDGQSLLKLANPTVPGITGNTVFLVTQFEYQNANNLQGEARPVGANGMYGKLPSGIAIATLDQNKTTGALTAKHYYPVPTTSVHGLWITCAGSLSPWNTHLSSEEYEPDAWTIASNTMFQAFSLNTFGSATAANPYHYGHVPEVTVRPDGTGSVVKHYCMGRISRELVHVMPDQRTVLMGDDATSGGIFMFIADVATVLSSGTLYAAQVTQTSAAGAADGGAFTLQWVKLGHASSIEIEALADSITAASQIMTVATTDPVDASYTKINYGNGQQWVKFSNTKAAAFLETHRYAAALGATSEFSKFEGVAVNVKDKKAYFAMAAIRDTMTANGFVGDSVKLKRISAGGVYEAPLQTGQLDTTGAAIDSAWVPTSMAVPAALLGVDNATPDAFGNTGAIDKLANPDNLKFSEALRTLFIGEDSGMHVNNFVWAYNVDTAALSRILSVPSGGECTGLQAVDNLNGFAYVMSNFQHPGDWESIHNTLLNAAGSTLNASINSNWGNKKKSAVGYLSGLPVIG